MGKPMGNGYPVAGIAVKHELVEQFGTDMRYFNTFGGNTVAIAAAQAVWNVIREEQLLENARTVGLHLAAGLRELAERHEAIGDVRGSGMYYGVEIVSDRTTKQTDPGLTATIVNGLRERRVLISATGPDGSVLKIRPPLVFSTVDADRLVTELDTVLSATI
jgi:4-aminobutyrate aminotransferase-like enzyme